MADSIPFEKIANACERAARYRRQMQAGRDSPFVLEQDIIATPVTRSIIVYPDGWAKIGTVADGLAGQHLAVFWNLETDGVRVERPSQPVIPSKFAYFVGPPLYPTPFQSPIAKERPFTARSEYIYTCGGQDFTPSQAERIAGDKGTTEGWSWRLADRGLSEANPASLLPKTRVLR